MYRINGLTKSMKIRRCFCLGVVSLLFVALSIAAEGAERKYLSLAEAQSVYSDLKIELPAAVASASAAEREQKWNEFEQEQDHAVRARLLQGNQDSLINLLLFGTSFTKTPRMTATMVRSLNSASAANATSVAKKNLERRISDLTAALLGSSVANGRKENERIAYMRGLLEVQGVTGAEKIQRYLSDNLKRVFREQGKFHAALEAARSLDASENFARRSTLYRERGISLDTSLLPNYAVEQSLRALAARGLFKRGSVRRVAIIGPGLDFVDKDEGFDFYPQQTVQPFAIIDSLLRLGLSDAKSLEVTTLDISDRVNQHIRSLAGAAQAGKSYTVQLPRDPAAGWTQGAVDYWQHFGESIGTPTIPVQPPPALSGLKLRAVRVRPEIAGTISPQDVNVVWQHLDLPQDQGFDLMIATNIFVYYDVPEQSLAMRNVEHMLRPGGFLLSNNALPEVESTRVHSIDTLSVAYSERVEYGDHIVWYQKQP